MIDSHKLYINFNALWLQKSIYERNIHFRLVRNVSVSIVALLLCLQIFILHLLSRRRRRCEQNLSRCLHSYAAATFV